MSKKDIDIYTPKSYDNVYECQRIKLISDLIPVGFHKSLDIGCGIGVFSKIMYDKGHFVTGVDNNEKNIEYAKKKYKDCSDIRFLNHDVSHIIEYNKNIKYDFILNLEIIEHLDTYEQFLKDLFSLLKTSGILIISTPNRFSLEGLVGTYWSMREGKKFMAWDSSHKKVFNSFEFIRLLKKQNLRIKKVMGYYFNIGGELPLIRFRIRIPFSSTCSFPLNMFGFNTIVVAEK